MTTTTQAPVTTNEGFPERFTQVASSPNFTLFLQASGNLWSCGLNNSGQLGIGSIESNYTPKIIAREVIKMDVGTDHAGFIDHDNHLWLFGNGYHGELGIDPNTITGENGEEYINYLTRPRRISSSYIIDLALAPRRTFILSGTGSVWACGDNEGGILGVESSEPFVTEFTQISNSFLPDNIVSIEAGHDHFFALDSNGSLWGWGKNNGGKLTGDGTTLDGNIPRLILENAVKNVSCGENSTIVTLKNGRILGAGQSSSWANTSWFDLYGETSRPYELIETWNADPDLIPNMSIDYASDPAILIHLDQFFAFKFIPDTFSSSYVTKFGQVWSRYVNETTGTNLSEINLYFQETDVALFEILSIHLHGWGAQLSTPELLLSYTLDRGTTSPDLTSTTNQPTTTSSTTEQPTTTSSTSTTSTSSTTEQPTTTSSTSTTSTSSTTEQPTTTSSTSTTSTSSTTEQPTTTSSTSTTSSTTTSTTSSTTEQPTTTQAPLPYDLVGQSGESIAQSLEFNADGTILAVGSDTSVRVYMVNGNQLNQLGQDITKASSAYTSLALSDNGTILVLGEFLLNQTSVYRFNGSSWSAPVILPTPASNGSATQRFGWDVDISSNGDTLIASDPWRDAGADLTSGAVYVYYSADGLSWELTSSIEPNDVGWGAYFGHSISMDYDGSNFVVGAYGYGRTINSVNQGQVRHYTIDNSINAIHESTIDNPTPVAGGQFGRIVSMSSDGLTFASASEFADPINTSEGIVQVFENISGTWTQKGQSLTGFQRREEFGADMALSGDGSKLIVGADSFDLIGETTIYSSGKGEIYSFEDGSWVLTEQVLGSAEYLYLGERVAISRDGLTGAVGTNNFGDNQGAISLIITTQPTTTYTPIDLPPLHEYVPPIGSSLITITQWWDFPTILTPGEDGCMVGSMNEAVPTNTHLELLEIITDPCGGRWYKGSSNWFGDAYQPQIYFMSEEFAGIKFLPAVYHISYTQP